ncbi:Fatty acyl-CoA reductase 3 [Citrus sinensis]|nr:Fatty acyl-CoA reductase 3 [Citrus sinensis]
MELGSVVEFLENKTILVSGVTGFVAKVFIEKILRVQPNVKKLYLLVRAADTDSAALRFQNEVLAKDVFNVLKEKWGTRLNSFISEKITFVPGDISSEDLGLKDSNLKEELWNELDIMVNSAAITKFDERYDVAFGINTLGAIHLVNFAKKCVKLKVIVHVSTAGERTGLILENPLDGASGLDFDAEMKVIDQKLNELKTKGAPQKEITLVMKNLGTERAKLHGWPNTYVFTKTMGEMLMQQSKENLSLVIIRPTVVTGTYKEPFPGWVEDLKTINTLFAGSAQGNLRCLVGETKVIMDVIPVDMVVNAMIVAMVAHAKQPSDANIYHVGSSLRNPVTLVSILDHGFVYFTKKPWINKQGKPVKVSRIILFSSIASFHGYMQIRYLLPLKGLQVANTVFHNFFKGVYNDLRKKVKFVMRVVEIYKPYFYFNGIFDDTNTEKLRMTARGSRTETDLFYFDPDSIEWSDYFMNTHIPDWNHLSTGAIVFVVVTLFGNLYPL